MKVTKIAFLQRTWQDNLGILWIASVLKENGFEVEVFVDEKNTESLIKAFSPHVIGFSCVTGEHGWALKKIELLKHSKIKALYIMGGPHATFFPEIIKNSLLNAICIGEGEFAMLELAETLELKKSIYKIRNFWFNSDGKIIKNDVRPMKSDLDDLPFPDRSYYEKYPFLSSEPYKIFITSRGCPFQCTFCFNHVLHEIYGKTSRYIRRRSVENVIDEILHVNRIWGIEEIRFSDDHFALDVKWLKEFASKYEKAIAKPYSINARADILDEEKITLLKKSGCRLVCFGVETGDETSRNTILNKKISNKQITKAASLLKKYKIQFLTSNIIGLPNETPEQAWKTIEINQKIKTDLPWYSMMQYYPGTIIYKEACAAGLIASNYSVDKMGSYFENDYLSQKNIGELQNIHSFSILASWFEPLTPILKILSKKIMPNIVFKAIFKFSYLILTLRRANYSVIRVLKGFKYYLR